MTPTPFQTRPVFLKASPWTSALNVVSPPLTRLLAVIFAFALGGCGSKKPDAPIQDRSKHPVKNSFELAANTHHLPVRFLMAAAWVESRLVAENASATYRNLGDQNIAGLGLPITETAFGLSYETLGLDPAASESATLESQISAYGAWLAARTNNLGLKAQIETDADRYYWVENLARLHRAGLDGRRNVQVVFAQELIKTLNEGFVWQDSRTDERVILPALDQPLQFDALPKNGQNFLAFKEFEAEIFGATFLPLATSPAGEFENRPTRVEVVHCPLSLSACLQIQSGFDNVESDVHLGAHYIVPQDQSILSKVIQVAAHEETVLLTDSLGQPRMVDDAIIVMIAGHSGRIVNGRRSDARPDWLTTAQITRLAQVIREVCLTLSASDSAIKVEECRSPVGNKGVQFHRRGIEEIRWGDIADFDEKIFAAHLAKPDGLTSEIAFQFNQKSRTFKAGDDVTLTVLFSPEARRVDIERLARCSDGQVVWEVIRSLQVRGQNRSTIVERFFDSGPNGNGDQFVRARVHGQESNLLGWTVDSLFLEGYEEDALPAASIACRIAN